jgi:hypothetical protein
MGGDAHGDAKWARPRSAGPDRLALLSAAVRYVRAHPRVLVKAAADAVNWRIGVPVEVIRWGVARLGTNAKAPKDIELAALPPALRVAATIDAMGTPLRASGVVHVDEVTLSSHSIRMGIQLRELKLVLMGESDSPLAILIRSGVLDLSKLGNVLKVLPKRPPFLVEADGDRVVVDLLGIPALAKSARLRKALLIIAPVLSVRAIETEEDYLYVSLRATPRGYREALGALGL